MKPVFKSLLVAGVLATAGLAAYSQSPGGMDHHGGASYGGRMDPAKMEQMMAKHLAELKAKLKLTPAQEGAWTTFTAAMKPPADMGNMPATHADLQKLATPERIDKMRVMRTQHLAEADKRDDAVKTFYASLNDEQKKVFDSEHARMGERRHGGMHGNKDATRAPANPPKP